VDPYFLVANLPNVVDDESNDQEKDEPQKQEKVRRIPADLV